MSKRSFKVYAIRWLSVVLLAAFAVLLWLAYWLQKPMDIDIPAGKTTIDIVIPAHSSAHKVVGILKQSGVKASSDLLLFWIRLSGQARAIKAGTYELAAGISPYRLIEKLITGDQALRKVTIIEGWTFKEMRAALAKADDLLPMSRGLSDAELMARLGLSGVHPEGRFFPDTYVYTKGSPDWIILEQAKEMLDKELERAWSLLKKPNPVLKSPEEVLKLASIIEKETNHGPDRFMVSAVFHNRLHKKMRLQTDPTVIYGLGAQFDGDLKRSHLKKDNPYNTYTRAGLPITPIALVGRKSLEAAVMPAKTDALYFVAKGDGSSHFSNNLAEHQEAVRTFILKQKSMNNPVLSRP